jgi:hypothetical protein
MNKVDGINDANMKKFEKEFFFLSNDVQTVMLNLFYGMFAWGTPRRWVKFARTQWRGSRIQLDTALPVLQILSPTIKVEEIVGVPDTFYAIWDTDDFDVEPDLKKLNEIISIRKECDPSIAKLLQLL